MYIIFFDVSALCLAFFILMLCGMGIFNEIGTWFYENFKILVFALIIVSILKAVFVALKCRKKWYEGALCGIVDSIRMIPMLLLLNSVFTWFYRLQKVNLWNFIFGSVSLFCSVLFILTPTFLLAVYTEKTCTEIMKRNDKGWLAAYLGTAVFSSLIQILLCFIYSIL